MNNVNRIQLDGDGYRLEEALANAALSPGHIVEMLSTGKVQKHSTEGGFGLVAVAVEDALQGKTITDAYAADARVTYHIQTPGTRFQGILKVGEKVAKGARLISDGEGRLIAETSADSGTTVRQIMAYAEEAVDLTDSDDADTLIAVRAA